MSAHMFQYSRFRFVDRRPSRRRTYRTRLRAVILLAALALLIVAPRAVHMMAHTETPVMQMHVVTAGDTLWEIAARHSAGADVRKVIAEIKRVNGLKTAALYPGQRLLVPDLGGR